MDEMTDEAVMKLEQVRGHCPDCGPARYADVVAEYKDSESHDAEHGTWSASAYRILQCGGCKSVYFQETYIFSEIYEHGPNGEIKYTEDITYYPAPAKRRWPEWSLLDLESGMYGLLYETYSALNVDARVLAATGARTVFDRASELLGVDPALTFKEKLQVLHTNGNIGASELANLDLLTDAGGAAAHRGWKPTLQQLSTIMSIVEAFVYRNFILNAEVKKLKSQIPPRQQRVKSESAQKDRPPDKPGTA